MFQISLPCWQKMARHLSSAALLALRKWRLDDELQYRKSYRKIGCLPTSAQFKELFCEYSCDSSV
jgi:hypothetical protein